MGTSMILSAFCLDWELDSRFGKLTKNNTTLNDTTGLYAH